jgi:hypothetical protein
MKQPQWMYRRKWWVGHSKDGFHISCWDVWLPYHVAEKVVETALAVVGHPCCGRGLGRIPGVDVAAYVVLNLPNRWWRHSVHIIEIPVTREQALRIQPSWADEKWIEDVEADAP